MKKTKKDRVTWEVRIIPRLFGYRWQVTQGHRNGMCFSPSDSTFTSKKIAKSDFLSFARRALKPGSWKIIEG